MEKREYKKITIRQALNIDFIMLPKLLFTKEFSKLSADAKVLYGFLLDRTRLSIANNWVEDNYVYIYFTQKETMELLNCWQKKVKKVFDELQSFGLIEVKVVGRNIPNKIFVKLLEV